MKPASLFVDLVTSPTHACRLSSASYCIMPSYHPTNGGLSSPTSTHPRRPPSYTYPPLLPHAIYQPFRDNLCNPTPQAHYMEYCETYGRHHDGSRPCTPMEVDDLHPPFNDPLYPPALDNHAKLCPSLASRDVSGLLNPIVHVAEPEP